MSCVSQFKYCAALSHSAECHLAEWHSAGCRSGMCVILSCLFDLCRSCG
jgi:hypothetical protein